MPRIAVNLPVDTPRHTDHEPFCEPTRLPQLCEERLEEKIRFRLSRAKKLNLLRLYDFLRTAREVGNSSFIAFLRVLRSDHHSPQAPMHEQRLGYVPGSSFAMYHDERTSDAKVPLPSHRSRVTTNLLVETPYSFEQNGVFFILK